MNLDSLFDQAMITADQAIEDAMASKFSLLLTNGESLDIKAIFDEKLEVKTSSSMKHGTPLMCEEGALTSLNTRLDRSLVKGAIVEVPVGTRTVVDVFYPDMTTTILQLSPTTQKGVTNGRFIRTE
ncbi:hypothetical protein M9194_19730 [Vibrio sp. S4M6]|uniref:hypothetical protein n=1 Tax=Vibrio sinus TaxID=2946865 RepID=UPI00202A1D10|nr:hypothetical protein [Vibrio sinus]MCL9783659.1 hypothetical protein [Vibrio sinus]